MPKSKQKNFRLSDKAVKLLNKLALKDGLSETGVMEYCIAHYAGEVGVDVNRAQALLLEHFAQAITGRKSNKPNKSSQ